MRHVIELCHEGSNGPEIATLEEALNFGDLNRAYVSIRRPEQGAAIPQCRNIREREPELEMCLFDKTGKLWFDPPD